MIVYCWDILISACIRVQQFFEVVYYEVVIAVNMKMKKIFLPSKYSLQLFSKSIIIEITLVKFQCKKLCQWWWCVRWYIVSFQDIEYIRSHYNIEDFIYYNHHQREEHGHLHHYILNPVFKHCSKTFLKVA